MTTIGLCLPQVGPHVTRAVVRDFSQAAEELGYGSLWVQEHFLYAHEPREPYAGVPGLPVPEQYRSCFAPTELLAAVAAWTESVSIGTSVLVAGYHWPVPLAHRLATLDQLAQGRLIAGFSVGWSREEHEQAGVDFSRRGRRMDEFVAALCAAWGPDPVQFNGEFFQVGDCDVRPKPFGARPRLLSGMNSAAGLRRTARYFDAWNPASTSPQFLERSLAYLAEHRPAHLEPLRLYQRLFPELPNQPAAQEPLTLDQLVGEVEQAIARGSDTVIVDATFWREMASPTAWARLPERLAPLLEPARSAPDRESVPPPAQRGRVPEKERG